MSTRRASRLARVILVTLAAIVYLAIAGWLVFGPPPGEAARTVGDGVQFAEDRIVQEDGRMEVTVDRLDARVTDEEFANLLLFVPVPILAALVAPRWWWLSIPVGVTASIGIEAVQRRYLDHRTPTWNDVRWNSAGILVGAVVVIAALLALRIIRHVRRR